MDRLTSPCSPWQVTLRGCRRSVRKLKAQNVPQGELALPQLPPPYLSVSLCLTSCQNESLIDVLFEFVCGFLHGESWFLLWGSNSPPVSYRVYFRVDALQWQMIRMTGWTICILSWWCVSPVRLCGATALTGAVIAANPWKIAGVTDWEIKVKIN